MDSFDPNPQSTLNTNPYHETAPTSNGATNTTSMKDSAVNSKFPSASIPASLTSPAASNAVNAVKNHPVTQDLANGPMATSVKNHASATGSEFNNLASSRSAPSGTAANDTPLTHYHSFFYSLLSWENPRATGITFGATILFIFACRYLPVIRYLLKVSWMTLGVVTLAEIASKTIMNSSVTASIRPRKYYKIPKQTLEQSLDDLEQFINFFVIETQRIVFAESVPVTGAAFIAAFLSYYLVKLLPMWGMALLGDSVLFLGPLVYVLNKEFIDHHIEHTGKMLNDQAQQVKSMAGEHAGKGFESVKAYTGDYTSKASEYIGKSRQKIPMPQTGATQQPAVKQEDFPRAPQSDMPAATMPSAATTTESDPIPAI